MARAILPEDLWTLIEPLLPPDKPPKSNGRPAVLNRNALTGILFVLRTGIPWEYLPQEMGCGCGMTCWRRLAKWKELGVWQRVYEVLLAQLHKADQLDWSRCVVDSSSVRAVFGGSKPAPIRPIAANSVPSITSSPMDRAFHLPSPSPAQTATM